MGESKTKLIILPLVLSTYSFIEIPTLPTPAYLRPCQSTSSVTLFTHCSSLRTEPTNTKLRSTTHMHKHKRAMEEPPDELGKLIKEDVFLYF